MNLNQGTLPSIDEAYLRDPDGNLLCLYYAAPGPTIAAAVLLIVHQVIGDGGRTAYDVHDRTLRQTSVEPDLLARVDAGIRTVGHFATLVGAVGGGMLATYFGVRLALALSAALFAAAALLTYLKLVAVNDRRTSQGESHADKT